MRRATVRAAQAGLSLALLVALTPLSAAHAQTDPAAPAASIEQQQAPTGGQAGPGVQTGVAGQPPAGGATAQGTIPTGAPGPAPAIVYGFFRDPLWPGPGQRFIAVDCPIGVGAGIIHYCPSLPPLAEPLTPPEPILPAAVLQCNPWFQYFPVCRRALDIAP
jgi:hypothetical protein